MPPCLTHSCGVDFVIGGKVAIGLMVCGGLHIDPHVFRGKILYPNLSIVDLVSHEEELLLDVLHALATGKLTVSLQQDGALVILVNGGVRGLVSLLLQEVLAPKHGTDSIIQAYYLALGGTLGIALVFP
jgi:hypothetical protein